jgi:ketosteroid isomerase-like protein
LQRLGAPPIIGLVQPSNAELVRSGFEAASRGDIAAVAALLDDNVYWGADGGGGCENRKQALRWMREGIARGVHVDLLETRELSDGRVLLLLQRTAPREGESERPDAHGQIVSFRDGKITQMLVYPTAEEALSAAGLA